MKRRIIEIDENKCNGCGACAAACHEGAIAMVNGKAKLMRDDYCDGLGDCLPTCPTGAITFVEREAAAYDETAVMENKQKKLQKRMGDNMKEDMRKMQEKMQKEGMTLPCGCPGTHSRRIEHEQTNRAEVPFGEQTSRLSSGLCRSSLFRPMRRILTVQSCSLPPTAPLMPMPLFTSGLLKVILPLWAVPNSMGWIIPKS